MDDDGEVARTLYTWAQGMDTRNWPVVTSVLCPEFDYDYSSHRAGSAGRITAQDWVDHARRRFATMQATQHSMTNPRVRVDGDHAVCRMYVTAWHVAEIDGVQDWCTIGGEYVDELRRAEGRWSISLLRLDRRWTVGNAAVLDLPTK